MTYLEGKYIKLVRFTDKFVTAQYVKWLNDPEINRFLYTGRMPISIEQLSDRNNECNVFFAIMSNLFIDKTGSATEDAGNFANFIGTISLNSINWIDRKGEIGYMLGEKSHWGYGIATEAVRLVSEYALNRLNLHKVEAGVVEGNMGSVKALGKNGFKQYGIIPEDYFYEGKYYDTNRFYKLQGW